MNLSLNLLVVILVMKLLSFHIYLHFQGLTTYKYILREKEILTKVKQQSKIIVSTKFNAIDITPSEGQKDEITCFGYTRKQVKLIRIKVKPEENNLDNGP